MRFPDIVPLDLSRAEKWGSHPSPERNLRTSNLTTQQRMNRNEEASGACVRARKCELLAQREREAADIETTMFGERGC